MSSTVQDPPARIRVISNGRPFLLGIDKPREQIAIQKVAAIEGLNLIIKQEATFKHWMDVVFRLRSGNQHFNTFYKGTAYQEAFDEAHNVMSILYLRAISTGVLGIMIRELDTVKYVLDLINEEFEKSTMDEVLSSLWSAGEYFNHVVTSNKAIYAPKKLVINKKAN